MDDNDTSLPLLRGDNVHLRWLTTKDVPSLYRIFSDARVMRYWSSAPLRSMQDAEDLLVEIRHLFADGSLYQWGLTRPEDDVVVGTCTLASIDRAHRRCEVGFALDPAEWGRGIASEAVSVLIGWAFEKLEMHRIEADIDPRNESSIRLVERLGFQREGVLRERYHLQGEVQDSLIFGLLRGELKKPGG